MKKQHQTIAIGMLTALVMVVVYATSKPTTITANAQVLEIDPDTGNASEVLQVTVRPNDFDFLASPNTTAVVQIGDMEEVDFKGKPREGITVVIDSQSASVTKLPVGIGVGPEAQAAPAPAPDAAPTLPADEGDGGNGDGDGDGNGDGGNGDND